MNLHLYFGCIDDLLHRSQDRYRESVKYMENLLFIFNGFVNI